MSSSKSLKIIVIDDEVCIRDTLRWYLEDRGHKVLTVPEPLACDVYQGHSCCQDIECANALIIDYRMPRMTGLEFIELLKERGCKGMTSKMLIITGNAGDVNRKKVSELNCSLLQKPVSYNELDNWLDGVLARQQL